MIAIMEEGKKKEVVITLPGPSSSKDDLNTIIV